MKKFPFLLLDAGPIIKLFELGIWDVFIKRCDVTVARTVAQEAIYTSLEYEDIPINLDSYEQNKLINIIDVELTKIKDFNEIFDIQYKCIIDPGEKESLAYLYYDCPPDFMICSADHAVFRVLGLLCRSSQGISLEEVLNKIGLQQHLENHYTKYFREKHTKAGETDSLQNRGHTCNSIPCGIFS
jgi:hypothetical protein